VSIANPCYWTGGGTNANLSTAANWANGPPLAGAELDFGPLAAGGQAAANNDTVTTTAGIRFLGASDTAQGGVNAAAYTLSGNSLTLTGPINNDSSNDQAIGLDLALAAGAGTVNTGSNKLTLSGNISGSGGLLVMGNGVLLLDGADNTYGGDTEVESGTLVVGSVGGLPQGSDLTVDPGGTVILDFSAAGSDVPLRGGEIAAVPEPGTLLLLAAGLGSAMVCRRYRRAPKGFRLTAETAGATPPINSVTKTPADHSRASTTSCRTTNFPSPPERDS
jgi:autotransporter-associated beta strand protein